jgi:hypothetical protein
VASAAHLLLVTASPHHLTALYLSFAVTLVWQLHRLAAINSTATAGEVPYIATDRHHPDRSLAAFLPPVDFPFTSASPLLKVFYNFDDRRFVGGLNGVTKLLVALGTVDTLLPSGASLVDR